METLPDIKPPAGPEDLMRWAEEVTVALNSLQRQPELARELRPHIREAIKMDLRYGFGGISPPWA